MGPHRDRDLFQHWLPARALPLVARAAFAIEMTGVMRKDVAAAVEGMNCSTSVFAGSNISLHRGVAVGAAEGKMLFPTVEGGEKLKEEGSTRGGRDAEGKRNSCGTKQTCSLPNTLQSLLLARWTQYISKAEMIQSQTPAF